MMMLLSALLKGRNRSAYMWKGEQKPSWKIRSTWRRPWASMQCSWASFLYLLLYQMAKCRRNKDFEYMYLPSCHQAQGPCQLPPEGQPHASSDGSPWQASDKWPSSPNPLTALLVEFPQPSTCTQAGSAPHAKYLPVRMRCSPVHLISHNFWKFGQEKFREKMRKRQAHLHQGLHRFLRSNFKRCTCHCDPCPQLCGVKERTSVSQRQVCMLSRRWLWWWWGVQAAAPNEVSNIKASMTLTV